MSELIPIIDINTKKDWYAARSNHGLRKSMTKSGLVYVFGGSLAEVKAYIDNAEEGIRRFFTWLPAEYVIEDMENKITYPI